jgi:tripartite ATP-independent transporter DctP family solute receptor
MRRIVMTLPLLALLPLLAASHADAQTTLKMAFVAPPPVWGPIADRYAQTVAQKTGDQVKIQSFGGGQLGSLPQNYAGFKTGQIDMMLADCGSLSLAKGGKDFNILFAPYAFRDQAHFRAFMRSRLFKEMIEKVEAEAAFKYVGYVSDRAARQLSTSKTRVAKPEDMKGLKIRVPETVTIMHTFRAWGAAPTPVAASELYLAMKQGLVDGQDNGFDAIAQAKYYEVQKYVTKIDYVQSGLMVLIAADRWSRLTPAQRTALEEAAVETEAWASKTTNDGAAQSIEFLKKQGMEIVEPDLAPFKKLAAEALAKFDGDLWSKGLAEKIQAVR